MVEMLRKVGVSPKLSAKWKGPYMVVQKCGSVYEVQLNTKTSKLIHYDLLKRCHSEPLPRWMQRARRSLAVVVVPEETSSSGEASRTTSPGPDPDDEPGPSTA